MTNAHATVKLLTTRTKVEKKNIIIYRVYNAKMPACNRPLIVIVAHIL